MPFPQGGSQGPPALPIQHTLELCSQSAWPSKNKRQCFPKTVYQAFQEENHSDNGEPTILSTAGSLAQLGMGNAKNYNSFADNFIIQNVGGQGGSAILELILISREEKIEEVKMARTLGKSNLS